MCSVQELEVLRPALHGVDDLLGAVIPDEHHSFEKSCLGVESDPQLALRILIIERPSDHGRTGHRDGVLFCDTVLPGRCPNDHATCAQASSAARIASERLRPSRSARAMTASSSSVVNRTGMT